MSDLELLVLRQHTSDLTGVGFQEIQFRSWAISPEESRQVFNRAWSSISSDVDCPSSLLPQPLLQLREQLHRIVSQDLSADAIGVIFDQVAAIDFFGEANASRLG